MNGHTHGHRPGAYNDENRRQWQDPEAVLKEIGLKAGDTFIDIGCGEGFFALPAAAVVGKSGRVYGLDVRPAAIERLRQKASAAGLANLQLTVGRGEENVLCKSCADFIFFGIALHDFAEPSLVLANAARMLKPGGKLVNLDWKKEPMPLGPPVEIRFSPEKATRLIESAGFKVLTVKDSGLYYYLIIAGLRD